MLRRATAITLVLLLGAGAVHAVGASSDARAGVVLPPDVPAGARYADGVRWAIERDVLRVFPDGTFRPKDGVNRLNFVTALWRREGRPTAGAPAVVADVAPDSRHRPAIDWAVEQHLIGLTSDHRLRPRSPLTRVAVAVGLWRLLGSPSGSPARVYVDVPAGAPYQHAADWAVDRGVLRAPVDQRLRPRAQVDRGRLAMALYAADGPDADPRPNLVVILTDDQTVEQLRVMTQVQRLLVDEGTTFRNAIATFPLCCPARSTLLTGRYAHNTGVLNNVLPLGGYARLDHTSTIATWLHDAGYATAHVGKYLNCYGSTHARCGTDGPVVPPGWDEWFGLPDPYPRNYGYMEFDALDNATLRHLGPAAGIYQTDVLADRAVADIENFSRGERPFLVNIWLQAPHPGLGPTQPNTQSPAPAPRHAGRFQSEALPDVPSYGEPDLADKPAYIQDRIAGAWSGDGERRGLTRSYQASLESLLAVDELVGRVVDALERTRTLDDTVVVFTSDNGLTFGEHRLKWWKVVPYEESIRVPLVVRGPGFPAGATASQVVGNIDLAPTLVDLAQVLPGRTMDGRSLLPIAADPTTAADRAVLLEDWPSGTSAVVPHYEGVRAEDWVYLEYETGERELYDLREDPYQLDNRAGDPTLTDREVALAAALDRLRGCVGTGCQVSVPPG